MGATTLRRVLGLLAVCAVAGWAVRSRCGGEMRRARARRGRRTADGAPRRLVRPTPLGLRQPCPTAKCWSAYDTNPDEAGGRLQPGRREQEPGRPRRTRTARASRSIRRRSTVAGWESMQVRTAVDDEDRLYLWTAQRSAGRGRVDGEWETVATIPSDAGRFTGRPSRSQHGEVYVPTDFRISTVAADGTLEMVAGIGEEHRYNRTGPWSCRDLRPRHRWRPARDLRPADGRPGAVGQLVGARTGGRDLHSRRRRIDLRPGKAFNRDLWVGSLVVLPRATSSSATYRQAHPPPRLRAIHRLPAR